MTLETQPSPICCCDRRRADLARAIQPSHLRRRWALLEIVARPPQVAQWTASENWFWRLPDEIAEPVRIIKPATWAYHVRLLPIHGN